MPYDMTTKRKYTEDRANHGAVTFKTYAKARKLDKIEREQHYSITDAITDMLHYAIQQGHDPEMILQSAGNHLEAETTIVANCAKCGSPISAGDIETGEACTDEGEGPEEGNTFTYCSSDCCERH